MNSLIDKSFFKRISPNIHKPKQFARPYFYLENCPYLRSQHKMNFHAKRLFRKFWSFCKYFIGFVFFCLTLGCYSRYAKCILTQHIAFHFGHDSSFYSYTQQRGTGKKKQPTANKNENNTKKSDIQEKTKRKKQARMKFEYGERMLTQVQLLCKFIEWQLADEAAIWWKSWGFSLIADDRIAISVHWTINGLHISLFSNGQIHS